MTDETLTEADTAPPSGHPAGLRKLFFTEMWERMSYYGMRALLVLFMVDAIEDGGLGFNDANATAIYGLYTASVYFMTLPGGWIAMVQHYFLSAWVPDQSQNHTYSTRVTSSGFNIAGFTSPALVLDPGQQGEVGAEFYAGPKDQYRLKEISPYLELSVDYGWLWWIAQPLFWLLANIHDLVGNWGSKD